MRPSFSKLLTYPAQLFALGSGSGLVPKAPCTFGTLAAIVLYFMFSSTLFEWQLFTVVASFFAGIYLYNLAQSLWVCTLIQPLCGTNLLAFD